MDGPSTACLDTISSVVSSNELYERFLVTSKIPNLGFPPPENMQASRTLQTMDAQHDRYNGQHDSPLAFL